MSKFWFQTFSGVRFDLEDTMPEMVRLEDIAHHLSLLCRFNGAVKRFYSVAQHCVLASHHVDVVGGECERQRRLGALLHDAAEAYVGDCVRPLKHLLRAMGTRARRADYDLVEERVAKAIARWAGLRIDVYDSEAIKIVDTRMLATERRDLIGPIPDLWTDSLGEAQGGTGAKPYDFEIDPWNPETAERHYLSRYEELSQ